MTGLERLKEWREAAVIDGVFEDTDWPQLDGDFGAEPRLVELDNIIDGLGGGGPSTTVRELRRLRYEVRAVAYAIRGLPRWDRKNANPKMVRLWALIDDIDLEREE